MFKVRQRALLKHKLSNRKIFSQLSTGEKFPVMCPLCDGKVTKDALLPECGAENFRFNAICIEL